MRKMPSLDRPVGRLRHAVMRDGGVRAGGRDGRERNVLQRAGLAAEASPAPAAASISVSLPPARLGVEPGEEARHRGRRRADARPACRRARRRSWPPSSARSGRRRRPRLAAGRFERLGELRRGGRGVEAHPRLPLAERREVRRQRRRLGDVGEVGERRAHAVGQLSPVDDRASARPRVGTSAKASGSGVWLTSEPRMLKSQATACGSLTHQRVALAFASAACDAAELVAPPPRPAALRACRLTAPSGGGGRSAQIASIGLARRRRGRRRPPSRRGRSARRRPACAARGRSRAWLAAVRFSRSRRSRRRRSGARAERRRCRPARAPGSCSARRRRSPPGRPARSRAPAEPVKPVSQASRSAPVGTYSFWCSSARGTTKPSSPRFASSSRSAATRARALARLGGFVEGLEARLEHG